MRNIAFCGFVVVDERQGANLHVPDSPPHRLKFHGTSPPINLGGPQVSFLFAMPLKDRNTPATLLRQMRRREQVAWQSFMIRYGNFLRRNCVRFGVTESLVEDVIQDVTIKILDGILSFERRGVGQFSGVDEGDHSQLLG